MEEYKLSLYNPQLLDAVTDFWLRNDYFKGIDPIALRKHLLWKYDDSLTHLWIVQKQGHIIGSCGTIRTDLLSSGQLICKGPWGMDSLVEKSLSNEERRCVFLKVFRGALLEGVRRKQPEIVLCFPNEVVRGTYLRTGWRDIPIFFKFTKSIISEEYKVRDHRTGDLEFLLIKEFESGWDALWSKFSELFSLVVSREHSYLNWRYFKNLEKRYFVFLVRDYKGIKGYVVLREEGSDDKKIGHIVDFLLEDQSNEAAFINKVIMFLALRGCKFVDVHVSHKRFQEAFLSLGFKKEKVDLFIFTRFSGLLKLHIENTKDWFITSGDGDVEMES